MAKEKYDFSGLKVGDSVWITKTRYRTGDTTRLEEHKVAKVGRKYIIIEEYRNELKFNKIGGVEACEGNYARRMVVSVHQYYADLRADAMWRKLQEHLRNMYSNPDLEEQEILAIAKILKIDVTLTDEENVKF